MNLKETLKEIPKTSYGAISISKKPKSKYYYLRNEIIEATSFLPNTSKISERCYCILNDINKWPKCECGCNQPVNKIFSKYLPSHGNKSSKVKEKKRQSFQRNYGVDNPSQAEEVKEKKRQSFQRNYGQDHFMKSEDGYQQFKQNMKERMGYENPFSHPDIKEKNRQNWLNKKDQIIEKRNKTRKVNFIQKISNGRLNGIVKPLFDHTTYTHCDQDYKFQCCKCGYKFLANLDDGNTPRCLKCYPPLNKRGTSEIEQEIKEFVESLGFLTKSDRKLIHPLEIDVLIPEKKLAIEVNGLYWHSEIAGGKNGSYHLYKTECCLEKDYRLIHIFEDEWHNSRCIVKTRLKHLLGISELTIGARKCIVKEIDSKIANDFVDKYHIQGACNASISLGAYHDNELVAVMSFCKKRFQKSKGYELLRFVTLGYNFPGLASKLLKYFQRNYQWNEIVTYADRRWSNGNVYEKLGFELISTCKPSYWYMNDYLTRHYRFNFRKSLLEEKLDNFNPELTEWQNMQLNGWDRIWDCGNLVYKMINENDK